MTTLPELCQVPRVQVGGGGGGNPAWVTLFMEDVILLDVEWEAGGGRCIDRSQSLASMAFTL